MVEITAQLTRREAARRLGAGVLFTFTLGRLEGQEKSDDQQPLLSSRLHLGPDGAITVLTGKVELGQGIRTTIAQAAAEELCVPPERVSLVMGDTALVPDDGGTWGSLTTPQTLPVIRQACASLRHLLLESAAKEWRVDAAALEIRDGRIAGQHGSVFGYEDLAKMAAFGSAKTSGRAQLIDPVEWRVCGKSLHSVNGPAIVTGGLRYSSDVLPEGVLFGKVLRGPNVRSKLLGFEDTKIRQLPGVRVVHEGDFLGVTAPSLELAEKAAALLEARWGSESLSEPTRLYAELRAKAKAPEAGGGRYPALMQAGSIADGLAGAAHTLKATYQLAYIAHVPLECRTAVAQWRESDLTVHCGTQAPFLLRSEIAEFFKIPPERVRIIVSDTGSGYGGKHASECELEAARLARGIDRPVRLAWSRAEETTRSYCRPAAVIDVTAAITADGRLTAWEFHNINGGPAGLAPPYEIANRYVAHHESESPLQQGSYRSLAAAGNTFARESHIDEMAHLAGLDPLEFRLRNLSNERLKGALLHAAERFGWEKRQTEQGIGYGLACNFEKGGHIALCTELEVRAAQVKLRRMVAAFDAGAVVNPDILSNQVEGALVQGIGGALFEELKFDRERIVNGTLSKYRVPRFSDVPEMEVILIDRRDQPSAGAGESPITAVAPAIAAGIFSACGKRIREMPMLPALERSLRL